MPIGWPWLAVLIGTGIFARISGKKALDFLTDDDIQKMATDKLLQHRNKLIDKGNISELEKSILDSIKKEIDNR